MRFDIHKKYICTKGPAHHLVRYVSTAMDGTYRFAITGSKPVQLQEIILRPAELHYIKTIG